MNIIQIIPCTEDIYVSCYDREHNSRWKEKVICFALIENNRGDHDSKKVVGMIAGDGIEIVEFEDWFDGYTTVPPRTSCTL
jgi:hypothetical protein